MTPFLAIDWGTSNLRGWRIGGNGDVEADVDLPLGIAKIPPGGARTCFEQHVRPALDTRSELPVIMCGMVGSDIGWRGTPYVECPVTLPMLIEGLVHVGTDGPPICIVPGVRTSGIAVASDVMRGEETQAVGWVALDAAHASGVHFICHPGTHSKWIALKAGAIATFVTAMTGELFDVMSRHSILRSESVAQDDDDDAFLEGVEAAGDGGALASRLFAARARIVADRARPETALSFLSGLLIGAEIAALPDLLDVPADATIHVVASPILRKAYVRALKARGWAPAQHDGEAVSIAGLKALVASGAFDDAR